jgi:hypothetical protein
LLTNAHPDETARWKRCVPSLDANQLPANVLADAAIQPGRWSAKKEQVRTIAGLERNTLVKEVIAFVAAGFAAAVTRTTLPLLAPGLTYGATSDPLEIRFVTGVVFFAVLIMLGRRAFRNGVTGASGAITYTPAFTPKGAPQETADAMAQVFAGVTDDVSRRRAILEWLGAVPKITALIPMAFYLRFGAIGPLGWGLAVFFDVYCLLWAVGLYFGPLAEYHSQVRPRRDWVDRIGAFWLVGCAFGPLFGWFVTEAFPITPGSWHWLYGLRAFLAAGIPLVLALPLLRYVRGKSSLVAAPLLVIITLLPVSTAVPVIQDLCEGPSVRKAPSTSEPEFYLKRTERSLGGIPF